MKGIHFASFYFRIWDLIREIRENKNPAKISTYTVYNQNEVYITWSPYTVSWLRNQFTVEWFGSSTKLSIVDVREFPIIYLCKLVVHYLHIGMLLIGLYLKKTKQNKTEGKKKQKKKQNKTKTDFTQ